MHNSVQKCTDTCCVGSSINLFVIIDDNDQQRCAVARKTTRQVLLFHFPAAGAGTFSLVTKRSGRRDTGTGTDDLTD